jgi:hypothetical protein
MAITKVSSGLISADASSIDLNIDAGTLYLDVSENRVGIGTTSPSTKLEVAGDVKLGAVNPMQTATNSVHGTSGEDGFLVRTAVSAATSPTYSNIDDTNTGMFFAAADTLGFTTAGSERMRIDSSGNLLVGKTSTSFGTAGAALYAAGDNDFVNDGNVMSLNRLSSDGSIVNYYKDSSLVGSIGANSNDIYIASTGTYSCGLMFEGSSGARDIRPCSSTGALLDGSVDLGDSTARFNDLYLDGGVHLGGTGSANKLDDYEEGTWTPDLRNGTTSLSTQTWHYGPTAVYTKIGDLVFIHLSGKLSAVGGTSSGELRIFGLPFSGKPSGGYQEYRMNFFLGNQPNTADSYQGFAFVRNNGSDFGTRLLQGGDNIFTSNRLDNDTFFTIFGCYKTNS